MTQRAGNHPTLVIALGCEGKTRVRYGVSLEDEGEKEGKLREEGEGSATVSQN